MRNPICLLLSIYYSIKHLAFISGHYFQTVDYDTPHNVHVIKCKRCGKVSVTWSWDSLEKYK